MSKAQIDQYESVLRNIISTALTKANVRIHGSKRVRSFVLKESEMNFGYPSSPEDEDIFAKILKDLIDPADGLSWCWQEKRIHTRDNVTISRDVLVTIVATK